MMENTFQIIRITYSDEVKRLMDAEVQRQLGRIAQGLPAVQYTIYLPSGEIQQR